MSACSYGLCSINTFGGLLTSTGYLGFKRNTYPYLDQRRVTFRLPIYEHTKQLDVRLKKEIVTVQSMGHGGPELHRLATKKELDRRRDSRQVTWLDNPSICGSPDNGEYTIALERSNAHAKKPNWVGNTV